jgi:hypothetical protein
MSLFLNRPDFRYGGKRRTPKSVSVTIGFKPDQMTIGGGAGPESDDRILLSNGPEFPAIRSVIVP